MRRVRQAMRHITFHRLAAIPQGPQTPFFVNLRGHRLRHCSVNHDFHRLLAHCGIARGQHASPRLVDFRHTFAVTRLLAWYREGGDVNARLPALATYLGHVNIASTQLYLRPTAELLAQVDQRFHTPYLDHAKTQGGSS